MPEQRGCADANAAAALPPLSRNLPGPPDTFGGLDDYLGHFARRVLADALAEAMPAVWLRRAEALEAAAPRPGDYHGAATREELSARWRRCTEAAVACRRHASLMAESDLGSALMGEVDGVLREVAA